MGNGIGVTHFTDRDPDVMNRRIIHAGTGIQTPTGAAMTPITVATREVEYEYGGTPLMGFVADDESARGRRPGVLVFPEWWGLNDSAKARARRLAELGYVAFVADVYGAGRVIEIARPEDAARMAGWLRANVGVWRGRAAAAWRQLAAHPDVDAARIAAIGHCLETPLQLAFAGADLKAVAVFHSTLPTPTDVEAKAIRAKLLVCSGEADPFVPEPARADFRAALDAAGVTFDLVTYDGVVHSFTSPDADKLGNPGLKYDRHADEDSWKRMTELLATALGSQ